MKKVGFVIPWYGDTIPGGAEADLRGKGVLRKMDRKLSQARTDGRGRT